MPPISGLSQLSPLAPQLAPRGLGPEAGGQASGGPSFQELLLKSLQDVNQSQTHAHSAVQSSLLDGELTRVEVLTATRQADLALRTLLQVRNKVLEAYNEIKNMQI